MLGQPPCTLHDYFLEQKEASKSSCPGSSSNSGEELEETQQRGAPRKRTKLEGELSESEKPLDLGTSQSQTQRIPSSNSSQQSIRDFQGAETQPPI
jgi:hypothetical protein